MRNFGKGLKEAFRFKWLLLLSVLTSIGVALLWSANIGAFYPILEVTLSGRSLQNWATEEIDNSQVAIANYDEQLRDLSREKNATNHKQIQLESQRLQSLKEAEVGSLAFYQRARPYIDRFCPNDPLKTIALFLGLLLLSTVLKHVMLFSNTMMLSYVSNQMTRSLRIQVFNHAMCLDRASFEKHGSAGILTHINQMSGMLGQGVMSFYSGAIREPLKIISCLVAACFISWRLLILCLFITPVVVAVISLILGAVRKAAKQLVAQSSRMHHVILETLNCMQTVQANCMEEIERERFDQATHNMMKVNLHLTFLGGLSKPIIEFMGLGMVMTGMMLGSYLVLHQETHLWGIQLVDRPLNISAMLVFFGLLVGASDPIRKFSGLFESIGNGIAAADAVYGLMRDPSKIQQPTHPVSIPTPYSTLTFKAINFSYTENDSVIENASLSIPFRSKIAIVGPNGSGKSTLLKLICRFYDPRLGKIEMDGVDLRELSLSDLRSRIAIVPQHAELFDESVAYNIRYGTLNATDEDVREAAHKAFAHDFISELPDGYESRVGQNGDRLSGGQRQRIALARAFLKNPEIMLLDEATSQIDQDSEKLILKALVRHTQDCTVLFVTHRESVLSIVDSLIRVENRSIVQQSKLQPFLPQCG